MLLSFGRLVLLAGALTLLPPSGSAAQSRMTGADLRGAVRAANGDALPGSTITVINIDTNLARVATSDDTGRYIVPALPPGTYSVTASAPNFRSQSRDDVVLTLGQTLEIDFVVQVAAAGETVTVSAETIVVPTGPEVGTVVTQDQIQSLPTNGRNFIGFAALAPGAAPDRTPLQGAAATSGLSLGGQRARSNNITVDGLDNNDPVMGAVRATFSQEATREFQVLVNSYSAEFGKASGGTVNIVTKSGTNVLHGSAFLFFRDKALNAASYFEKFDPFGNPVSLGKGPFRQGQWGGTLGGPVRKDRSFYFLSYEGTSIRNSRPVTIDPAAATLLNGLGFPVELGNVPFDVRNTEVLAKIDHRWTPTRTLALRVSYADIDREGLDDFGGIVAKSRATEQLRTDWAVSAAETDVVSDRVINELRGQYAYENQEILSLDPVCDETCLGIDEGGPTLEVTGVASVGRFRFSPFSRRYGRVQVLDTLSYYRNSHHVKVGVDYSGIFFPSEGNLLASNFGGRYIFTAIPPLGVSSSLDGLQKGIPAAYVQGFGNSQYADERYSDLSLFAQDEWQIGRVTLRPGLRYQVQFWQDAAFNLSDVGGTTFSYGMPHDRNNLAPRVAMSYDVTGKGRTIVHGSYGLFYDNMIMIVENAGRLATGDDRGVRTFAAMAPLATRAWTAPGHRLSEPEAAALVGGSYASATAAPSPSMKTSFAHQAAAGIDRQLAPDVAVAVNAVYFRGFNLPGTLEYNPTLPARLGPGRRPNDAPCSSNPARVCVNGGIPGSSATVLQFTSFGESWYKGMTVELRKRLSHRYQLMASYTLSKSEDTSTDFQTSFLPQNNGYGRNPSDPTGLPLGFDPRSERGPSTQDQRHRFVLSGVYDMPWRLQLSGIVVLGSGRPFTPLAGSDLNGDANGGQFPPDRARATQADESSSVGRNSEMTVGYATVDTRVSRQFALGRRGSVDVMLEAFNLFNRVNFVEDTNQSSFVIFGSGSYPANPLPAYGHYTMTMPPRQVQLAVRVSF